MIVTFIPAAGRSDRMGGSDKLLELIKDEPILRFAAKVALGADLGPVIVGLRPNDSERRKALKNLDVEKIEVADAAEGMSASLRAGAGAAQSKFLLCGIDESVKAGMMVVLPDMPEITSTDLRRMSKAFQNAHGSCMRAETSDGKPGHPVLFAAELLSSFKNLKGDKGAASLLKREKVLGFALPGQRARIDLDTPGDWAAWRDSFQEK